MTVEPTFTLKILPWFKNIRPICSRTCSRTCSCSRTRTEQEQNFVDFREQEQNENKQYFEHREREQNKNKKNMRVLSPLLMGAAALDAEKTNIRKIVQSDFA